MQVNDQTMKTLAKYGEVLQTTKNKIVCSLKTGQHLILDFEDDLKNGKICKTGKK